MNNYEVLSYEYRGEVLDLSHLGNICIVDVNGNVIYALGNPETVTCFRSSSKPLQALPTIALDLDKKYGLTGEEAAIFSGSQTGEEAHANVLESILLKTGLKEDNLVMLPCYPANEEHRNKIIASGKPKRKIYHNCAGKHISAMLLQRELGGKQEDYWKITSPAQKAIKKAVCILSECEDALISLDGCGVPVFSVPLKNIAVAYKNLANIKTIKDNGLQQAAERYIPLLHQNPAMLRGNGYLCTVMNMDENIVAKGGANGVYAFGIKDKGLGISFKISDGTESAWPLIVLHILKGINSLKPEHEERLMSLKPYKIMNDNNKLAGRRVPAFSIKLKGEQQH